MDEQRRMEAQKKLQDEERVRRMKEGGEEMRAQLAMEEAQRSREAGVERGSGLTPEEERRREMERGGGNRGLGETQQAQMAMWGKEAKPRQYAEGERARYEEPRLEKASTGESFTGGPDVNRMAEQRQAEQRMAEQRRYEQRRYEQEPRLERASSGESFTSGPNLARERRPSEMAGRELPREERYERRTELDYPAGTGSRYREYQDTGRASTGESFTSGPEATGQAPQNPPSGYYGQEASSQPSAPERMKGMAAGVASSAKGATQAVTEKIGTSEGRGQVTSTAISKGKEVSHMVTSKAKEFNESNRAEDVASRAGETIGKVLRKTISVAKGMGSGLKKGMSSSERREAEQRREGSMEYRESSGMERERTEGREMAPRTERETVERESTTREYPQGEERRYQEVRRKEQQ